MVENRNRNDSQKGLPFLKAERERKLKADFSQAFCVKCRQLRSLLKCSSEDLGRCIVMYYMDFPVFVSRIIMPVVYSFCKGVCVHWKTECCAPWKDLRTPHKCFFTIGLKLLKDEADKHMIERGNRLLAKVCQGSIYEIFGTRIALVEDDSFETLASLCDGEIGQLTEDVIFHYINNKKMGLPSDKCNIVVSGTQTKPKKEFFFKEKI